MKRELSRQNEREKKLYTVKQSKVVVFVFHILYLDKLP